MTRNRPSLLCLAVPIIAAALASCRSSEPAEMSLVEREQIAFGYSNEIRRIEALRAQYEEQKETLEILFSELDRQGELITKLERDIAQASGRVAALVGQLAAEQEKEKAVRAEIEAAKKGGEASANPAPPPSAAPETPPKEGPPAPDPAPK